MVSAIIAALACGLQTPVTLHFTTLMNGVKAGGETDVFRTDGTIDCIYEFNDRGRGPRVAGKYHLSADGYPLSVDLTGVDYFKAPVDEHFETAGGRVAWHSTAEKGEGAAGGFYTSINGGSAELGTLAG